jgi:hypothetical protein
MIDRIMALDYVETRCLDIYKALSPINFALITIYTLFHNSILYICAQN